MTPIKFITGKAGTGKSTLAKQIQQSVLCSTTGISAVNMGTVTINSLLGYFDTADLVEKFYRGKISRKLDNTVPPGYNLILDEVSMMDATQLDYLARALDIREDGGRLILTGDFCQLPPVDAPWAFTSKSWDGKDGREWETERLTKVWRQDNLDFLEGLNFLREGKGAPAIEAFQSAGVEFSIGAVQDFPGVTIMGKNNEVDEWNQRKYEALNGKEFTLTNTRWGDCPKEWKLIPDEIKLKVGAQVMLLANQYMSGREIMYANGDVGIVKEYDETLDEVIVSLFRNQQDVVVYPVNRVVTGDDDRGHRVEVAGISYYPIRLAYASTVHKTQGLTLDYAQVDLRGWMMGKPAMTYVACSRCRSPQGLRLVGHPGALADRCAMSKEALAWI